MRENMRNVDRALSNLESMPEGFNHLRRMFETVQVCMKYMGAWGACTWDKRRQIIMSTLSLPFWSMKWWLCTPAWGTCAWEAQCS